MARGDTASSWGRKGKSWERRGGGVDVTRGFEERVMGGGGACMVAVLVVVCRRPGPSGSDISVSHQLVMLREEFESEPAIEDDALINKRPTHDSPIGTSSSASPQFPNGILCPALTHASPTSSSERGEVPGLSHRVAQGRRCSDWTGPVDHRPQGGRGRRQPGHQRPSM